MKTDLKRPLALCGATVAAALIPVAAFAGGTVSGSIQNGQR